MGAAPGIRRRWPWNAGLRQGWAESGHTCSWELGTFRIRYRPLDRLDRLVTLQAEYATWLQALPEATRDGPTGEALQAIVDLDLDEIVAIQPPRDFGRD